MLKTEDGGQKTQQGKPAMSVVEGVRERCVELFSRRRNLSAVRHPLTDFVVLRTPYGVLIRSMKYQYEGELRRRTATGLPNRAATIRER